MMRIVTFHGRDDPDADMQDWGFYGPVISGVVGLTTTYGVTRVLFATEEAMLVAQKQTGWSSFGGNFLEMITHQDLLVVGGKYFGDWAVELEYPLTRALYHKGT